MRTGATARGESGKPLSSGEQLRETSAAALAAVVVGPRAHPQHFRTPPERRAGVRNARTDENRIRILDHAGARARATTGESPPVSVVSEIAGNSRLNLAAPPDLGGAGSPNK